MNQRVILAFIVTFLVLFLLTFFVTSRSPEPNFSAAAPCNWVKLNQEHTLNFNYGTTNITFHVPSELPYLEVNVTGGSILASCSGLISNCTYYINGMNCGKIITNFSIPGNNLGIADSYIFPQECVNVIHDGANKIKIYHDNYILGSDFLLKRIYIEMKVRPANC